MSREGYIGQLHDDDSEQRVQEPAIELSIMVGGHPRIFMKLSLASARAVGGLYGIEKITDYQALTNPDAMSAKSH